MDGGQEENSKRLHVFMFPVVLMSFSEETSILVVIYFTPFILKKMGPNEITLYQKIILALLAAGITFKSIRKKN